MTPRTAVLISLSLALTAVGCGDDTDSPPATTADTAPEEVMTADAPTQIDTPAPPEDTAKPPEDTAKPPEDTAKPPEDTAKPPEDTEEPPDCAALAAAAAAAAAPVGACAVAGECATVKTTVCGLCTVLAGGGADTSALEDAAAAWEAACGSAAPDDCCQAPPPAALGCLGGQCVGCDYVCNMDCVCKKDPAGCDLPVCEEVECSAIEGSIAALLPGLSGCASAGDCMLFEYPICGSAGCFQRAVSKDADLTDLWDLAQQAQTAGCSGFTCGCGYGAMPVCLQAQCTLCPGPGCAPSCENLLATIKAEAALAKGCVSDADCMLLDSPICAEPGLGCYAIAVATTTPIQNNLGALLELYTTKGCPTADCDCDQPKAHCDGGSCISW